MSLKQINLLSFILMLVLVTSACSGGAGEQIAKNLPTETINNGVTDKPNGSDSSGGIGGSGVMSVNIIGPITAITDTINVKGIDWKFRDTDVYFDDLIPPSERILKIGMVVDVFGTINPDGVTGQAHMIDVVPLVVGPIETIDENVIIALGQQIVVTDLTIFDPDNVSPPSISGLTAGDVIVVHGTWNSDNNIEANLIQRLRKPPAGQLIRGLVVSAEAYRIQVGGLVIDIENATYITLLDDSNLLDGNRDHYPIVIGDYVFINGRLDVESSILMAEEVYQTGYIIEENEYLDVEGFILISANPAFTIHSRKGDIDLIIDEQTKFYDGLTPDDLKILVEIRLKGVYKNGLVQAEEIYRPSVN